jgi:hypothetical protein
MNQLFQDMLALGYKESTIRQYKNVLSKANVNLTTQYVDLSNDTHGTLHRAFRVFQDWIDPHKKMRGPRSPNSKKTNLKSWCLSTYNPTLIFYVYHLVEDMHYAVDTGILYSNLQLHGKHDNNKNYSRAIHALANFEYPCIDDNDIVQHLHKLLSHNR